MIFATRPSALARWQTDHVIRRLQEAWPDLHCETVIITTRGDRVQDKPLPEIGGKGLFTLELEGALLDGRVHASVHSLKDMPIEDSLALTIGLILERADPRDVLICPAGKTLDTLPTGATIGTSSLRRRAQILAYRPDLQVVPIRGNVDTRIRKVREGQYDAIVLAAAGVTRLGLDEHITHYLLLETMLPAPSQGALAVQCRADDDETLRLLAVVENPAVRAATTAERAFLAGLGGGCSIPVAAYATLENGRLVLQGFIAAPDGSRVIRVEGQGTDPHALGKALAKQALSQG